MAINFSHKLFLCALTATQNEKLKKREKIKAVTVWLCAVETAIIVNRQREQQQQ